MYAIRSYYVVLPPQGGLLAGQFVAGFQLTLFQRVQPFTPRDQPLLGQDVLYRDRRQADPQLLELGAQLLTPPAGLLK